ncbi:MAG: helix-turn-helix transcriptional regulator, partial [Coriobacteriales bacterium]|nr:helix-turn-helix transcriptional regulator [Coriobacteriales bacterium]
FKLTNKEKTSAAEATATPAATPAAGHATPTSDHLIALAQENGLSPRETEVFMLLARGRSRSFIQQELVLADGTVKTHISRIYQKLGVSGRQELISLVLGT